MDNFAAILAVVLKVFGSVLSAVLTALALKALAKLGLEKTAATEAMVRGYVKQGVNAAEAWGAANGKKGNEKLQHALGIISGLIEAAGLKKWADDKLVTMIEGQLTHNAASGSGVGNGHNGG